MTTASGSRTSCIRHKENKRFFILFEDLLQICEFEYAQACALRVLEVKTNDRLTEIYDKPRRTRHMGSDNLFLTVSYAEYKHYSLKLYAESSYQDALAVLEHRGFVESRAVKLDARGNVIHVYPMLRIVEDDKKRVMKEYDFGGDKSYVKQYRLKYEVVNAAIDKIEPMPNPDSPGTDEDDEEGQEVPGLNQGGNLKKDETPPLFSTTDNPPVKSQGGYQNKQGGKNTSEMDGKTTRGASVFTRGLGKNADTRSESAEGASESTYQKKEKNPEVIPTTSKKESVSVDTALSLLRNTIDFDWLKTAAWNADTLIMLASALLPVPSTCDDETWERDWQKPAERLLMATATLEPERAWERINQELAYMTQENSPSWWVQQRARQSPVTLRNAADNYVVMDRERHTRGWYSSNIVNYTGPRWPDNEPTPTIDTPPIEQPEEAPSPTMDRATADALAEEILSCYPTLNLIGRKVQGGYVLGFEYAAGKWRTVKNADAWRTASPGLQHRLEEAIAFSEEREAVEVS